MKKLLGLLAMAPMAVAACGGSADDSINVYVRNSSSGTREAFTDAISSDVESDDNTALIAGFSEQSGTSAMIGAVEGDANGIGYISLASLPGTDLKALDFNGIEATNDNVTGGDYKMSRDFSYVTVNANTDIKDGVTLDTNVLALVDEWHKFLGSADGKRVLEAADVIVDDADFSADAYTPNDTVCATANKTDIIIGGSSSVQDAAEALSTALGNACDAFDGVHAHAGSSASKAVLTGEMHIGFSSSGIREEWKETGATGVKVEYGDLGQDAVVVVVHEDNSLDNITTKQLNEVFFNHNKTDLIDSNITSWGDLS